MRQAVGVISTTRVDAHGDILQKDELERMGARMAGKYTLIGYGHDPRHPPIGRVISTRLIRQEDGEYELVGTFEIWDKNDNSNNILGDGRRIELDSHDYSKPTISYNPLFLNQNDPQILSEIAKLGFQLKDDRIEKAYESIISTIIIYGSFIYLGNKALGAFIDGFFNQLGQKTAIEAINGLKKLYLKPLLREERLVTFRCPIIHNGVRHELEVILEKSSDIEELSKCNLSTIEELVENALVSEPRISQVVIGCTEGKLRILYTVRYDGFPSVIAPISDDELTQGALSPEGTAERKPHREGR